MKPILFMMIGLLLLSCSGEELLYVDTIPPAKPDLIHHLGDTGDFGTSTTPGANYYNLSTQPDLENNGIDAVAEGNYIQLQWLTLQDTDIDYLEIFRFTLTDYLADTLNFVTKIDSINYTNQNLYFDTTPPIDRNLFYFISAVDEAGNFTLSDTVCYKLLDKPIIIAPPSGISVSNPEAIEFAWDINANVTKYRLLLFNEDRHLIWQYEPLDLEDPSVFYAGPAINPGTTIIWRLDAFGHILENVVIFDQQYTVLSGSESEERVFYVQ